MLSDSFWRSSATTSAAARGASEAACSSCEISARVWLAWAWAWAVIRLALCSSASQMACWRCALSCPACAQCWPRAAPRASRRAAQASRRAASCAASSDCCACRAASSVCTRASALRSIRAATSSTRRLERCSNPAAKPSSACCRRATDASCPRCCAARAEVQPWAASAPARSSPEARPSSCCREASATSWWRLLAWRARPSRVDWASGCSTPATAWALSATPALSDCSSASASCACAALLCWWNSCWRWASWAWLAAACCSTAATMACMRSTSSGISAAWPCSSSKACSRRCACEYGRRVVAICASRRALACSRSRRHSADSRPSMAEAATPAIEVPKAKPRPFTGAASEARMASRSVALSSARPVPRRVAIMPSRVPSMPSNTSRPTR